MAAVELYQMLGIAGPETGDVGQLSDRGREPKLIDMDVVDAKIEAAEARTDTKFAQVMGELGKINARLDHTPSTPTMIATVVTTGVAILGISLTIMAFGGDRFDGGFEIGASNLADKIGIPGLKTASDSQAKQINGLKTSVQDLNVRFDALDKQIGTLIEAVQKTAPKQ